MDEQPTQSRNNPAIAFNAREFVIGLAIAAVIVFSVAGTRWYVRARTVQAVDICQANLRQIDGAKQHWTSEHGQEIPTWTNLVGPKAPIAQMPICPGGGTYTLGPVGQAPRCSIPEHTKAARPGQ